MPTNAEELRELARAYKMESEERQDGLKKMTMHIGEAGFPVLVGHNKLPALVAELKKLDADKVFLGYDDNSVKHCAPKIEAELEAQGIRFYRCVMGVTESAKVMSTLDVILESFLKGGGTRKTVVVPVGGGIVANTFGLAAGLLFRGIRLVQVPTTFLNAHDAAASSQKQAINHSGYKNIVGVYHMPTLALVDTAFYKTLGATEIKAGLGELTKNAALFGGAHYELMKKTTMRKGWKLSGEELCEATCTGLGAKDMLLKCDPKEKHIALLFEYGHTVGHALELTEEVVTSHGEGVSVGMLAASLIANKMGIMSAADRVEHDALVYALDPQVELPARDITDEVLEKVCHDNKRGYMPERAGFCPFILARRIGELHAPNKYYLEYVPVALVREAIVHVVGWLRGSSAPPAPAPNSAPAPISASPPPITSAQARLSPEKDLPAKHLPAKNPAKRPLEEALPANTAVAALVEEQQEQLHPPKKNLQALKLETAVAHAPYTLICTTDIEVLSAASIKLDHPATQGGCSPSGHGLQHGLGRAVA